MKRERLEASVLANVCCCCTGLFLFLSCLVIALYTSDPWTSTADVAIAIGSRIWNETALQIGAVVVVASPFFFWRERKATRGLQMFGAPLVLFLAADAGAFTIETPATEGCHERITREAVTSAGWPYGDMAPLAEAPLDRQLIRELPFKSTPRTDLWTAALLIGVRDNDLHGSALMDVGDLPRAHLHDAHQHEHCLRGADDDGHDGNERALRRCREFIMAEIEEALGDDEVLDVYQTEQVRVGLKNQMATVALSRYAFHVGRALHALQDSYSHTRRVLDKGAVMHVFNYHEHTARLDYNALRDGFPHQSAFDACEKGAPRVQAAIDASHALLRALADGEGGRAGRRQRARRVVADALRSEPTCAEENNWCGSVTHLPDGSGVAAARAPFAVLVGIVPRAPTLVIAAITSLFPKPSMKVGIEDIDPPKVLPRFGVGASVSGFIDSERVTTRIDGRFQPFDFLILSAGAETGADLFTTPKLDIAGVLGASVAWTQIHNFQIHTVIEGGVRYDFHRDVRGFASLQPLGVHAPITDNIALELAPLTVRAYAPNAIGATIPYELRSTVGVVALW